MKSEEIRSRFLKFFEARGHKIIPSASLVPENDATTLFTGSGMQPLVPYLLGQNHPEGTRIANSQKCFRSEDIEEVGDNRHTTFFEMLGNWSFGDYWKKEQLSWFYEFLTKEIGLDKTKLAVTCFEGDEKLGLPRDTESFEIWKELGIPESRIFFYPARKNWWSRSGEPKNMPIGEPGGSDSEMFYEFTQIEHNPKFGEKCHPNCDCGRFLEIGNSVFMEYRKTDNGFEKLPRRNVDFGGGLERITAAANDGLIDSKGDKLIGSVFEANGLSEIRSVTSVLSNDIRSLRIMADHFRSAIFLIADGVLPSNVDRGYFLRRLIRRAVSVTISKKIEETEIKAVVDVCAASYKGTYDEIFEQKGKIIEVIAKESKQFESAIKQGLKEFEKIVGAKTISGYDAFLLFSSYGLPIDMIVDLAKVRNINVDIKGFQEEFEKHRAVSRVGAEKKFKGGLADHSEQVIQYHTAHHLLLKALQIVLGAHVKQRGSNITSERLRIDFSHGEKMTDEQKREVERIVNEKIKEGLPVIRTEMAKEEAEKLGAEHEFGAKYPDRVSIYSVGPLESAFSIEFCGGPHVTNTSELKGTFKIKKEEAVAAGVRRIKAVLE